MAISRFHVDAIKWEHFRVTEPWLPVETSHRGQ